MRSVIDELGIFVKENTDFASYYSPARKPTGDAWKRPLDAFLTSTMDEIRLRHAGIACQDILIRFDAQGGEYFRKAVLRREISRDITYPKHRDHSAHTVYNWLLGWYIVCGSPALKAAFDDHFTRRGLVSDKYTFWDVFGDVFVFVSLLHDIGYMFEGALLPFDPEGAILQAKNGMGMVCDYFEHNFWRECQIYAISDRRWFIESVLGTTEFGPRPASTLGGIADSLRYLGEIELLRKAVQSQLKAKHIVIPKCIGTANGLIPDAFELWLQHYDTFSPDMRNFVGIAEAVFYDHLERGIDGAGLRVLDHAMCSGLVLLQYSTLYYRIYHGLGDSEPADPQHAKIWRQFRREEEGFDYSPDFWWSGVLWSTAATALHNILQISRSSWPADIAPLEPLSMKEDPLTYLGILVDCLQEWDRYTVQRHSVLGGMLPVQGRDVTLGVREGKTIISFTRECRRAKKVREALDESLADWSSAVEVIEV